MNDVINKVGESLGVSLRNNCRPDPVYAALQSLANESLTANKRSIRAQLNALFRLNGDSRSSSEKRVIQYRQVDLAQ